MRNFCGCDTKKSIANLSQNEETINNLVDMVVLFVFQVAKKDASMYLPSKQISKFIFLFFVFFHNFLLWSFNQSLLYTYYYPIFLFFLFLLVFLPQSIMLLYCHVLRVFLFSLGFLKEWFRVIIFYYSNVDVFQ